MKAGNILTVGLRFFWLLIWMFPFLGRSQSLPPKPNIIIILADDLGFGDVSYNRFNPDFLTPNIDSLAINGVSCSNGYVTHPFCSPSRAALLTGRYQQRFGYENQPEDDASNPRLGLPSTEVPLPQLLKKAGYVCGMVGKWHLGIAPSLAPNQRGFDNYFGFLSSASQYYNASVWRNNTRVVEPQYLTDAFTREAVAFISNNATQPFFLYLAYNAPHAPYDVPPASYMNQVASITDSNQRIYAAMVTGLDAGVGQVLQALRANGILNKTLIFFLSDNGAPNSPYSQSSNYPLRGYKFSVWEGGIRVPFVVQWSGTLPANKVYNQPVSSLDIASTAAAVAGVSLPTDRVYDGINLIPFLTGQQLSSERSLFWRWFSLGPTGPPGSGTMEYAARDGPLKLVQQGSGLQLFNLSTDISETTNLAMTQPSNLASLKQLYNQWDTNLIAPLWAPQNVISPLSRMVLAGDWNTFNILDSRLPWNLARITAPGLNGTPDGFDWFTNTIHVASVGGDTAPGIHSFAIVAGGYARQWGGATINIDGTTSIPAFSGTALGPRNSVSLEDNSYYSFRTLDWRFNNQPLTVGVMKTSALPVSVSVSGQTPATPRSSDSVSVRISTNQPKSPEERIYLRWSTDTFITSHMVQAAGAGTTYSAIIPPQPTGALVQYCITTSTVDLSQVMASGIIDFLTLSTTTNSRYLVTGVPTPTPTPTPSATPTPSPTITPTPSPPAVVNPIILPPAGNYHNAGKYYFYIAIANAPDSNCKYTEDGTSPSETRGASIGGNVGILGFFRAADSPVTIKAIAWAASKADSNVVTSVFTLDKSSDPSSQLPDPQIGPNAGTYYVSGGSMQFALVTPIPGGQMRYTKDGSTPASGHGTLISQNAGQITLSLPSGVSSGYSKTWTLKVIALGYSGKSASNVKTFVITLVKT